MRSAVRDLYKRLLFAGREYPKGLPYVRHKAKEAFFANKDLESQRDINKAIAYGRWMASEVEGVSQLKKYRAIKDRYYD